VPHGEGRKEGKEMACNVCVDPGHGTLSAALNEAASNSIIHLVEGSYIECAPIEVTRAGITIRGARGNSKGGAPLSKVISRGGDGVDARAIIRILAESFDMEDVAVRCERVDDPAGTDSGRAANKECDLHKCIEILGSRPGGGGCSGIGIRGCTVACCGGIGIEIGGDSSPSIENCTVSGSSW
jgi:hypothetical protein